MTNYEAIVHEIQSEAKQFQNDNHKLKSHLNSLLAENDRLRVEKAEEAQSSLQNFKRDFIAVADTTITNLQNQILMINKVDFTSTQTDYYLNSILIFNHNFQEKEMFENLWKSTAFVLEREVPFDSISKVGS